MTYIAKMYARATISSNLKSDELSQANDDTDTLRAMALSDVLIGGLGSTLYRAKYGLDGASCKALEVRWFKEVERIASVRAWSKKISLLKISEISLNYWLFDACPSCTGREHDKVENTPFLAKEDCPTCKGTGKAKLVCDRDHERYVLDMIDDLERKAYNVGGEMMHRLNKEMNI